MVAPQDKSPANNDFLLTSQFWVTGEIITHVLT